MEWLCRIRNEEEIRKRKVATTFNFKSYEIVFVLMCDSAKPVS